jgi:hypothetical protein
MSTLLPFLYQTRTLQRLSRTGLSPRTFRALVHSRAANSPKERRSKRGEGADIPFDLPEGYENPDDKYSHDPDADSSGMRSTITKTEQGIFSRIFDEIAARHSPNPQSAAEPGPSTPADGPDAASDEAATDTSPRDFDSFDDLENFGVRTAEPNHELSRHTINVIVQDASEAHTKSRRRAKSPFPPQHPLDQAASAGDWERALNRFPPKLRAAARMALGVMEADEAAQRSRLSPPVLGGNAGKDARAEPPMDLSLDPLSQRVQNEALRRVERNRVEAKMRAAETDFALWDVLEAEVFPMVRKLGIDEDSTAKRTRKNHLPLHIYGPLYPTYLLSALRLLDSQFARSSPLALHVLPRVRELGPASYVLGVSTPFYNELARLLWSRYGDPAAVFDLLDEMRISGLYCDESTRAIVRRIDNFLDNVAEGRWGPFLRELGSLPEYHFVLRPRVNYWLSRTQKQIQAQQEARQSYA